MKKTIRTFLFFVAFAPAALFAQATTQLNIDSGIFTLNNTNNSTSLAIGDVLQFGYYMGATNGSTLFTATWVPLTGDGGANSAFTNTTIGYDSNSGAGIGTFAFSLVFTNGSSTSGVNLPSTGQILALRFYNNTTVASSTYYGAVSDASWLWVAPSTNVSSVGFSLGTNETWLSNSVNTTNNTAFTGTPTAVPEPGSVMLLVAGIGSFLLILSKRRKVSS